MALSEPNAEDISAKLGVALADLEFDANDDIRDLSLPEKVFVHKLQKNLSLAGGVDSESPVDKSSASPDNVPPASGTKQLLEDSLSTDNGSTEYSSQESEEDAGLEVDDNGAASQIVDQSGGHADCEDQPGAVYERADARSCQSDKGEHDVFEGQDTGGGVENDDAREGEAVEKKETTFFDEARSGCGGLDGGTISKKVTVELPEDDGAPASKSEDSLSEERVDAMDPDSLLVAQGVLDSSDSARLVLSCQESGMFVTLELSNSFESTDDPQETAVGQEKEDTESEPKEGTNGLVQEGSQRQEEISKRRSPSAAIDRDTRVGFLSDVKAMKSSQSMTTGLHQRNYDPLDRSISAKKEGKREKRTKKEKREKRSLAHSKSGEDKAPPVRREDLRKDKQAKRSYHTTTVTETPSARERRRKERRAERRARKDGSGSRDRDRGKGRVKKERSTSRERDKPKGNSMKSSKGGTVRHGKVASGNSETTFATYRPKSKKSDAGEKREKTPRNKHHHSKSSSKKPVSTPLGEWTETEVLKWTVSTFESAESPVYAAMRLHHVDGMVLLSLTEEDAVDELYLTPDVAEQLVNAVERLSTDSTDHSHQRERKHSVPPRKFGQLQRLHGAEGVTKSRLIKAGVRNDESERLHDIVQAMRDSGAKLTKKKDGFKSGDAVKFLVKLSYADNKLEASLMLKTLQQKGFITSSSDSPGYYLFASADSDSAIPSPPSAPSAPTKAAAARLQKEVKVFGGFRRMKLNREIRKAAGRTSLATAPRRRTLKSYGVDVDDLMRREGEIQGMAPLIVRLLCDGIRNKGGFHTSNGRGALWSISSPLGQGGVMPNSSAKSKGCSSRLGSMGSSKAG